MWITACTHSWEILGSCVIHQSAKIMKWILSVVSRSDGCPTGVFFETSSLEFHRPFLYYASSSGPLGPLWERLRRDGRMKADAVHFFSQCWLAIFNKSKYKLKKVLTSNFLHNHSERKTKTACACNESLTSPSATGRLNLSLTTCTLHFWCKVQMTINLWGVQLACSSCKGFWLSKQSSICFFGMKTTYHKLDNK